MQKINVKKLKRDCFIATLIPLVALAIFQVAVKNLSFYSLVFLAMAGAIFVCWYLYEFFNYLEEMTWQQQLNSVVQKLSSAVLIADWRHNLHYMNDSFHRLALMNLLNRFDNLPEWLATLEANANETVSERCKRIGELKELLDGLSSKLKIKVKGLEQFESILIPLYSPTGKRWGTLVEFVLIKAPLKEALPFAQMLEQLAAPFLFVNPDNQIVYVNLSLKMLLVRHHTWLQQHGPAINVYEPIGMSCEYFLSLINQQTLRFNELIQQGLLSLKLEQECFQLSFQCLWGHNNEKLGTLVLWQDLAGDSSDKKLVELAMTQFAHPAKLSCN